MDYGLMLNHLSGVANLSINSIIQLIYLAYRENIIVPL